MKRTVASLLRASAFAVSALSLPLAAQAGHVSTLAGSGLQGFTDGGASTASFLMPVALAYDSVGNLLVVDAAAQRIRRVHKNGRVDTVAGSGTMEHDGSVRGGFADGNRGTARFNWPRGIAVAKNGTILIADTGNHCIRAIAPSGRVSVYAGSPNRDGDRLGPRTQATFSTPTGIAADSDGNVYVADPHAGLRKIDAAGNVTAMGFGHAPIAVSVIEASDGLRLLVVDADGIFVTFSDGRRWRLRSSNATTGPSVRGAADPAGTIEQEIAMQSPVGYPVSLAVKPDGDVFFGDPRTNAVRYIALTWLSSRTIAGMRGEDASGDGAGFRDGDDAAARFNTPLGAAVAADGSIAIADAGNRRIRLLRLDQGELAEAPARLVPAETDENIYHIVYVGPSWTWFDSIVRDSISGNLEQQLVADRALASTGMIPNVRSFNTSGAGVAPLESIAKTLAEIGIDKVVVFDVTSSTPDEDRTELLANPAAWQPAFVAGLRNARQRLAAAHIRLVVALHPHADEFSANEYLYARMGQLSHGTGGMIPDAQAYEVVKRAVAASGVDMVDTFPDFRDDALHPSESVSGMVDSHYGPHGREIYGRAIARGLERLAPWASP